MYEVGDKVIYQGADKSAYKKVGILKSIEEKDGKPQLTVEFEGGETFTAPVDDWSRKFTNACNAIKVGDTVTYKLDAPGNKGKKYIVLEEGRTGYVWLADMDGRGNGMEVKRADLVAANSCRSTNSVVRNAMAANRRVARNAITGTGRVNDDYDLLAVYNPNGQLVYKCYVFDCPYKKDDWKYDASTRTYRVDGPNGDYRTIAKISNAVARNARTDWEMEIYKLTEKIKQLVAKSQRENGEDYPTTVFKDALKAMRGY